MAVLPYLTGNEDKVLGIMKMYSRMGAYPLDGTSVFNTKEELLEYIAEAGSYAYPGQVVAVANGDVANSTHTGDYSLYIIKSDRSIQEIGRTLKFATLNDANEYINANTDKVEPGQLVTITENYKLYIIKDDYSLGSVSSNEDKPSVTITTYTSADIV